MLSRGKKQSAGRRPVGQFDTLISQKSAVTGDVRFSGGLHVDGRVEGNLLADGSDAIVRISELGEVSGDIRAPHVIINGKVNGDVHAAEHLELAGKAAINGNVYYNLLEIAMGAEVNGSLVREKDEARKLLDHQVEEGDSAADADPR